MGGTVTGNTTRTYDNSNRVVSINVNGSNSVSFQYNDDSQMTHAGNLSLSYAALNGLLTALPLATFQTHGLQRIW